MESHTCCSHGSSGGSEHDWHRTLFAAKRTSPVPAPVARTEGRRKLWELLPALHCSVIGTCLGTEELRTLYEKVGRRTLDEFSDHDLHGLAVQQAGERGEESRALQRLLDRRHETTVRRFERAKDAAELATLWVQALRSGEVPGAYWAVLTHRKADDAFVRKVFGDVHMLSHRVGAANRAELGRTVELEQALADARALCDRQQRQITRLLAGQEQATKCNSELARQLAQRRQQADRHVRVEQELRSLLLEKDQWEDRLARERARRVCAEAELEAAREALRTSARELALARDTEQMLRAELAQADATPADEADAGRTNTRVPTLHGLRVLYVGGRAAQVNEFRNVVEAGGGELLSHDGGLEERHGLLASLVRRADVVLVPIECVSHEAAGALKRLCRKSDTPFVPLRTASQASLVAALSRVAPALAEEVAA